jgi:hypothetical protein
VRHPSASFCNKPPLAPDRVVQWTLPEWPVICAVAISSSLPVNKPMDTTVFNTILRTMFTSSGVLGRITSHALRRGAARDIAHLPKGSLTGTATKGVAASIFHTNKAHLSGLTADYVGLLQNTVYNARATSDFNDRLAPKVIASPTLILKPTASHVIDQHILETLKGDVKGPKTRDKAKRHLCTAEDLETYLPPTKKPPKKNRKPRMNYKCPVPAYSVSEFKHVQNLYEHLRKAHHYTKQDTKALALVNKPKGRKGDAKSQ